MSVPTPNPPYRICSERPRRAPFENVSRSLTLGLFTALSISLASPCDSAEPDSTQQGIPKSPSGAAWRSLALPGWGQFYNGKKIKGSILAAAELGSVAAYFVRRDQLNDEFVVPGGRGRRNEYVFVVAGVIFYNVVDAFVDAHLDVVDWGELSIRQSARGDPRLVAVVRF